jgi:type II secretory pathway component PulK
MIAVVVVVVVVVVMVVVVVVAAACFDALQLGLICSLREGGDNHRARAQPAAWMLLAGSAAARVSPAGWTTSEPRASPLPAGQHLPSS